MDTLGHETRNYQCIKCGKIHNVEINKVYNLNDDLYYATYCAHCKEVVKHLDVGVDKSDVHYWEDPVLDKKYY